MNWIPVLGQYDIQKDSITFLGKFIEYGGGMGSGPAIGNLLTDIVFTDGKYSLDVEFERFDEKSACEIILSYDTGRKAFLCAGVAGMPAFPFNIRTFTGTEWVFHASSGDKTAISSNTKYHIEVTTRGSEIHLSVNHVKVCTTNLQTPITRNQIGIFCAGDTNIKISNFKVDKETPKAFVVMQFTSEFNEVYTDVIKQVCEEFGIVASRADESYTNGLVINDIVKEITQSTVVIADITPANPNVYYEVGYAHATNKPTILVANRGSKLPFDVSPFRVLFYENTIGGKGKFEEGLRNHLRNILGL